MIYFIIIILLIFIIVKLKNVRINWKSFLKKGLPKLDDRFAVYFVTGRQGSGKTYYAISLALKQMNYSPKLKSKIKIKTNIRSLKIPNVDIEYFTSIQSIYYDTDEYCIFIIDEIARKYDKNSRTDTQLYAFLNQSRKMHRVCIMITQEWKEVPMWLRRPVKYMITSIKVPLLSHFGLTCTSVGDAENMIFNKDTLEWDCPILYYIIYKRNVSIANLYDTFEPINML